MKIFKYFFALIILSIFGSCQSEQHQNSISIIKVNPDDAVTAKLSQHFEAIDYILLDYPDSLPIVNAYAMQLTDDRILVESRETAALFIFDRGGNLQNVIREYGEGPDEFVLIDELYVRDNRIRIHSYALKKWLTFDFEGNFLEEGITD